jgi:excisionase family DNA binding protein
MTARQSDRPYAGMTQTANAVILVSQLEAARLLGVERTTIWRMCSRGDLERVRIGRRALISTASINAYISART